MGLFPRVAQWDDDGLFDIIAGTADGSVRIFRNLGGELFDEGSPVLVGPPGGKVPLDVGSRSTPCLVDWDEDGDRDLLVGAYFPRFHLLINEGGDFQQDFREIVLLSGPGGDLDVPSSRSSPDMRDLDGDGAKDLLSGDNEGRLWFFPNLGSDAEPLFHHRYQVESASVPYDIANLGRSRPRIADWNDDGHLDLLVGSCHGTVHLLPGGDYTPDDVPETPAGPARLSAWPNPFNPWTTLGFRVPEGGASVRLEIFDAAGRRRATLLDARLAAGPQARRWNGRDEAGRPLPSGVYLCRLLLDGRALERKLVMLK